MITFHSNDFDVLEFGQSKSSLISKFKVISAFKLCCEVIVPSLKKIKIILCASG